MQIKFNDVSFKYNENSEFEVNVLSQINLSLNSDKIIAIAGQTGSGKSTLSELINRLLVPTEGEVIIDHLINSKAIKVKRKELFNYRKNIGFLFQFSENQLFEDSVIKDVMFGIKNFYPKENNIEQMAKDALKLVGLNESFYYRSPFELSGGEKKRVAIAGVIAYKPKLLILDEPTIGLDEKGKYEIMNLFKKIHESGVGLIIVTHDMDIVSKYADEIIILDNHNVAKIGKVKDVFKEDIEQYHLKTPNLNHFVNSLKVKGLNLNEDKIIDIPSLIKEIKEVHG